MMPRAGYQRHTRASLDSRQWKARAKYENVWNDSCWVKGQRIVNSMRRLLPSALLLILSAFL